MRFEFVTRTCVGITLCLSLSGCIVTMREPVTRFESPEAKGKTLKGDLGVTVQGTPKVVFVPDTEATPPITNDPRPSSTAVSAGFKGGLGIYGPVDVYARIAHESPSMIGLKVQVLGAPEVEARDGNLSAALLVGGGYGRTSGSEFESSVAAEHTLNDYAVEAGGLLGYRIAKYFLPYAGAFYTHHWNTGRVKQTAQRYSIDENGNQVSGNLGLQIGIVHILLRGEFAAVRSNWSGNSKMDYVGGTSIGGYW